MEHESSTVNTFFLTCNNEERLTFTAAAITGQIVTCRTGAAVATRRVNTGVQTQSPSLAVMEQLAFIDV